MTEFEQQVAEALDGPYKKAQGRVAEALGMPPMMQRAAIAAIILDFRDDLTPCVAAAIDVVVAVFAEEVEGEHGLGRGADGDDYKKAFQAQRAAALAALRGDT